MKIGIISDTHDQIARVKKAVAIFNKEGVELVVHCGDIIAPFTLEFYKDLKCPIKFLFGNNTGDVRRHLEYAEELGLSDYEFGTFFSLEADNKKIVAYHGDDQEIVEALIECDKYDCVFSGHTHMAKVEKRGNVLAINPGSLNDKYKEEMTNHSLAIYNPENHEAEIIKVEAKG